MRSMTVTVSYPCMTVTAYTNFKPKNCPYDLLEICYFYIKKFKFKQDILQDYVSSYYLHM